MEMASKTHMLQIVPIESAGLRVDICAFRLFPHLGSKSQAKKWIRRGDILLNGQKVDSSRYVQTDDQLELKPNINLPTPLKIDLPIVEISPHFVVVNKPAGLFIRGKHPHTLIRALRHHIPRSDCHDALPMAQPVHRLDQRTSGLVICARTARAQVKLGHDFQNRTINKKYRAVVCGRLGSGQSLSPIDGKTAETHWTPIRHIRSIHTDWITEIDIQIMTGRTHQIRRHLSEIGHPILGDDLYTEGPVLRSKGLFLCATSLYFNHPIDQQMIQCQISPPEKFENQLTREERRWQKYNPAASHSDD
jgi:23S rRNA pseudouridine1911/1915/1917 synthase